MSADLERWVTFGLLTALMCLSTVWHIRQHRQGRFKGFRWPAVFLFGHRIVTDRDRNPIRFAVYKWALGAALIGIWIGSFFLFRVMLYKE